jgi:hypothetical protein
VSISDWYLLFTLFIETGQAIEAWSFTVVLIGREFSTVFRQPFQLFLSWIIPWLTAATFLMSSDCAAEGILGVSSTVSWNRS